MTQGRYNRTALVLSGGGARCAYEAGVLKALREVLPQPERSPFSIYCGASGGAFNAASLALAADDFGAGVDALVAFWSAIRAEQVYKATSWNAAVVGWLPGVRPQALFDNSPLMELLSTKLDFDRIETAVSRHSLRALCITCSGYASGQSVSFFQGRPDLDPWQSRQRGGAHVKLTGTHVLASMAAPFLFPAVKLHREYFGDGCVREPAPLSPAVHLGADRIMVIASGGMPSGDGSDAGDRPQVDHCPSLADTVGHILSGFGADSLLADIERMAQVNRLLARIPEDVRQREGLPWRPIDLLVVEPSRRLDLLAVDCVGELPWATRALLRSVGATTDSVGPLTSYLLFEAVYTQKLIDLGYRDAISRRGEIADFVRHQTR